MPYLYLQSTGDYRCEPALICGFFGQNAISQILHIVSMSSSVMKKSMPYVKDELFSGLKLTNLGENSLMQIRIRDLVNPRTRIRDGKKRIREKHSGSSTLIVKQSTSTRVPVCVPSRPLTLVPCPPLDLHCSCPQHA